MTSKLEFNLPYPPSVNKLYAIYKKMQVLTAAGRKYYKDVDVVVRESGLLPSPFNNERLSISILTHQPDKRRRDLDNILKAIFDSLTKSEVWQDDSQIDLIYVERSTISRNNGYVEIKIEVIE